MKRSIVTASACFGLWSSTIAAADEAVRFTKFLGVVSAIEDACASYYVRTDATMGNHLSASDYQYAMTNHEAEKRKAEKAVALLGCEEAAKEAVKLTDLSFFEVWEIREP